MSSESIQNISRGSTSNQKLKLRRQPNPAIPWTESYEPQQASPFQELSPGTRRYLNPKNLRERSVFVHLFTEDIWDLFLTQINTYHVQSVASEPDKQLTCH